MPHHRLQGRAFFGAQKSTANHDQRRTYPRTDRMSGAALWPISEMLLGQPDEIETDLLGLHIQGIGIGLGFSGSGVSWV